MLTSSFPRSVTDHSGIFIRRLCQALVRAEETVSVVSPGDMTAPSSAKEFSCQIYRFSYFWPKKLQKLAYGSGGIPANLRRQPWLLFQVPFFLISFLMTSGQAARKENADLIHAHWIYSGLVAWIIKGVLGIPFIVTLRGEDTLRAKSGMGKIVAMAVLRQADGITTVNLSLKNWLISEGISAQKITFIRNGVDLWDRDKRDHKSSLFRFIFVGSLIPRKDVRSLILAFSIVKGTEQNASLMLVGEGEERADLEQVIAELDLEQSITFLGPLSPEAVRERLAASDCLVLPSRSEGTPNVVLEAMATGIPVVATDLPGTREILAPEVSGLLSKVGEPDDLAEKLLQISRNPSQAREMGERGKASIIKMGLSWDQVARRYQECYQRACAVSQESSI